MFDTVSVVVDSALVTSASAEETVVRVIFGLSALALAIVSYVLGSRSSKNERVFGGGSAGETPSDGPCES